VIELDTNDIMPSSCSVKENELEELIKTVNSGLDDHEKLQFVAVVNYMWEPENGFLTLTNKIRKSTSFDGRVVQLKEKKVIWHKW